MAEVGNTQAAPAAEAAPVVPVMDQPVPMSFPSILLSGRNPHLAYLQQDRLREKNSETGRKGSSKENKEGKRWLRRKENAHFSFNPHITPPSSHDLSVAPNTTRPTFPVPLPPYLPRTSPAPSLVLPTTDPTSAVAGHYTMSLRGVRKAIRRAGPRAEILIRVVEKEIQDWLTETILNPALNPAPAGRRIGTSGSIFEISRSHAQLIWNIEEDAFARYIVHATSRFYGVVSFSKDRPESGSRLTYLLRPNASRLNNPADTALATPPVTELDSGSEVLVSDRDTHSELSDIESDLGRLTEDDEIFVVSRRLVQTPEGEESRRDTSSHLADLEESGDESVGVGVDSLTLDDSTPRPSRRQPSERFGTLRAPLRSGSSPSRSPARRHRSGRPGAAARALGLRSFAIRNSHNHAASPITFSEFLFG